MRLRGNGKSASSEGGTPPLSRAGSPGVPAAPGLSEKRRAAIQRLLSLATLICGLAVWAAASVRHARGLWFFGDDFEFLLNRTVTFSGAHGLLVPHNEHWSTLPILLFRLNFAVFGMHHYLPYALLPIGMHLLICLLGFVLLRWSGAGRWVSILAVLAVAFLAGGAGAENTLWAFQVGFLGSGLFGLVALVLVAVGRGGRATQALGVVALVLSLMCSGMGVVMVLWVGLLVFARDGVRAAAMTIAVPTAVYGLWYAAYGHGHTGAPPVDLSVAPIAAMRGLGTIWSSASGIPGAGPVLLLAMVVAVVLPNCPDRLFAVAGSGLVAVVCAYALLGYSRSGIGIDATVRSRYIYFGVVLTAPALAAGLQILGRSLARRAGLAAPVAWLTAAATVVAVGLAQADSVAKSRQGLVADNQHRIVAAGRLVESGAPLLRTQPMPDRNPDVTVSALERRDVQSALPPVAADVRAELYVAVHLQVDVGASARSYAPPADVRWRGFGPGSGPSAGAGTCVTRTAPGGGVLVVAPTGAPTEVRLTVGGGSIGTQLRSGDQHSPVVNWPTQSGVPVYVASTAGNDTLRIVVPPGPATVCGR